MQLFGGVGLVLPLGLAIVAIAALFRMLPRAPRKRLRRSVILYGFYVTLSGLTFVTQQFEGWGGFASGMRSAKELCELLLLINLAALLLFDWLLSIIRLDVSDILHDLTVGAAYLV